MKIEIETTEIINNDFRQKNAQNGDRWYVRKQPILLFKNGSKYPDKGFLTLSFSDKQSERDNAQTMPQGSYELQETAFYFNKNGDFQVALKAKHLKLTNQTKSA